LYLFKFVNENFISYFAKHMKTIENTKKQTKC